MSETSFDDLVQGLLGPDVVAGAMPCVADPEDLPPVERLAIGGATVGRQREFATGRVCARRLLAHFGGAGVSLPVRRNGAPLWPEGFTGSIAHSNGLCVVAVARATSVRGIGIDVEVARGIDGEAWDLIGTARELAWLQNERDRMRARLLAAALFCAKESTFKALHGERNRPFEPRAIEVDWDGEATHFGVRIRHDATPNVEIPVDWIQGTLLIRDGWILSGVVAGSAQLRASGRGGTQADRVGATWR